MTFAQGLAYPFRPGAHQRVRFDIPSGLLGADGFNIVWPRLTLKQAVRLCGAQGKLSAAGQAALPGAIDEDHFDAQGNVWGKTLADGALTILDASNWSGRWVEQQGGDDPTPLDRVIWYGDWFYSSAGNKTAIDIREELQTSFAADELAFLRSALTDSEIDALLWDTPQSAAGGSYAPTIPCLRAPFFFSQFAQPNQGTLGSDATPVTDLANGTTGLEAEVSSASYPFVAGDVGKAVIISGGAGWTTGTYTIVSVADDKATLDIAPAAADAAGGEWIVQTFDYSPFVMTAEGGGGQGTVVSWVGSGQGTTAPNGATWATKLARNSHLKIHDTTGEFGANLVWLETPGKIVRSYQDGSIKDPGQQSAGLWMDAWKAHVVDAEPATTLAFDDPGSLFKKFIADLKAAGGAPDWFMWDIKHSPTGLVLFAGFAPSQSEQTELTSDKDGALVGGLGQRKTIASLAATSPTGGTIVTLANDRIPHIDADVGVTGEQDEHTFTFDGVTGTPDLNGVHKIKYNDPGAGELSHINTTLEVPDVPFVADVENSEAVCYGTHAPMQDARWPMLGGVNIESVFGDELDSFDIKRGTAGGWQEHTSTPTNGVQPNWRGDERMAMLSAIWHDYEISILGQLFEWVATELPNSTPLAFHYHQPAAAIFPWSNMIWVEIGTFSVLPKLAGIKPQVAALVHGGAERNYWSRKSKQVKAVTHTGTDREDWNALLFYISGIKAAAACTSVPNIWWFGMERDFGFFQEKYYKWLIRFGWLTGWQPVMHIEIVGETTAPLQKDINAFRDAADNAETRIGGSDFQGFVLDDPHHDDLFDQKVIRLCRDVGGKFLNAVLIHPDEYDGGNFVVNGTGIDVVDALGTTVLLNIPNATVTEEIDPGAWITQTQL